MHLSLERELQIPAEEEPLAPKEEPHEVVEKPQIEEQRVDTSNQLEPSREGRKRSKEVDILVQDARENVGAPSNKLMKRKSLDQYTS